MKYNTSMIYIISLLYLEILLFAKLHYECKRTIANSKNPFDETDEKWNIKKILI